MIIQDHKGVADAFGAALDPNGVRVHRPSAEHTLKEKTMLLAERTQRITPSSTSRMRELANELRKSGVDVINFAAGELDGDASDLIKNAAKIAIDKGCNKYTPTLGMKQLREGIAERRRRRKALLGLEA